MEQRKILNTLIVILLLSCIVVSIVILKLGKEIFYLPDKSADDIVEVLADANITISRDLISTRKERGTVYVCNSGDYNTTVAGLLTEKKVKYVFTVPDGELIVTEDNSTFEFGDGFSFRYKKYGNNENLIESAAAEVFSEQLSEQKIEEITQIVIEFMERGSEKFEVGGNINIITSVERIWENNGKYYAMCSRSIGGVEVNDNKVYCVVENNEVISASGTWSFLTLGESYSAQLSDIINILFNVKKELVVQEDGIEIVAIDECYSLYTYGENEGLCLIPCLKIVTSTAENLIYNAIDGTLYTKK